jgi:Holliday junction resolvasome RuvABC ATP-dependent DNA helicase subunit
MNVEDFAIDIFIDIPPKSRIIVIDINPWREFTTSKLFSYEELEGDI